MKQPRKVALINVADYPRDEYGAFWEIGVQGSDEEGYEWRARLVSYEPLGYEWQGKVHKAWPAGVPTPAYPSDRHLPRQAQYVKMTLAEQEKVRRLQEEFRRRCAEIYETHPKPVHLIEETLGAESTRDAADTAAQQWVLARIGKHKRKRANPQSGYALALGPLGMLFVAADEIFERWLLRPLLALAFSTTARNERVQRIQVNIDLGAGAGLLRILDGTRPATCGTATTLLAELTFSDPCAPAASSAVLTMSAITADSSANATGTATWFRCVDSTGTCVLDGAVGTSGSDLNLNSTSISIGQNVAVSSFTITDGNA